MKSGHFGLISIWSGPFSRIFRVNRFGPVSKVCYFCPVSKVSRFSPIYFVYGAFMGGGGGAEDWLEVEFCFDKAVKSTVMNLMVSGYLISQGTYDIYTKDNKGKQLPSNLAWRL